MPHTVNAREPVFTSRDLTTLTVHLVYVVSTLAGDVGPVYTGASEAGDVGYALVDGVGDREQEVLSFPLLRLPKHYFGILHLCA